MRTLFTCSLNWELRREHGVYSKQPLYLRDIFWNILADSMDPVFPQYICSICSAQFTLLSQLKDHIDSTHEGLFQTLFLVKNSL